MPYPVRCPVCRSTTRVELSAVGNTVTCRTCESPFRAVPEARVRTVGLGASTGEVAEGRSTSFLLGLSLLPFGLPLLWVLTTFLVDPELFSVLVSVAIAVSTAGLALGVAVTRDWSGGTRVKAILALVVLAYGIGGVFYFLKKDWIEEARKQLGRGEWREYTAPDKKFHVKMPGRTEPAESPISDWALRAVRVMESNSEGAKDTFLVAYGAFPENLRRLNEDDWFDKVKQLIAPDDRGKLIAEKPVRLQQFNGREYRLVLRDGGTNRVVRIFRVKNEAFLLLVEGAFFPMDHADVRKFFDSLYISPPAK